MGEAAQLRVEEFDPVLLAARAAGLMPASWRSDRRRVPGARGR
jgi:hypothetical protein